MGGAVRPCASRDHPRGGLATGGWPKPGDDEGADMRRNLTFSIKWLVVLPLILVSCRAGQRGPEAIRVDMAKVQDMPMNLSAPVAPLRIAIAAVISPEGTVKSYQPLLDYLSAKVGRPVELVQRRTYAEVNDLVRRGDVDLAFVCTSAYTAGRREFGMRLLVAPVVNGATYYQSQLIVPSSSSARSILDLRGQRFAFTDPMSFTGRTYPTYMLLLEGERPADFFGRTFFTYSHDDAIRAVAKGIADGAAVDSLVLDFALARDKDLRDRIRVIHTSDPFGIPPVVVGPAVRQTLELELKEILIGMHRDAEGRRALEALDYDRFVTVSDELYDTVAAIELRVAEYMGEE